MQNKMNNRIRPIDGIIRPKKKDLEIQVPKQKFSQGLFYFGIKMAGVFSAILVISITLSSVGSTVSYFSDIEMSTGNRLQAGVWDNVVEVEELASVPLPLLLDITDENKVVETESSAEIIETPAEETTVSEPKVEDTTPDVSLPLAPEQEAVSPPAEEVAPPAETPTETQAETTE